MTDEARGANHRCRPESGVIEGAVFYSRKSRSWVMTVVPPAGPPRQQRMDVRYCPWCGRDLHGLEPDPDAAPAE